MSSPRSQPLAEAFASFTVDFNLRSSPLRSALLDKAKLHILDGSGVALAATTMEDNYASQILQVVGNLGSSPDCTLVGFSERAAPPLAALVNGSLIHGCEYDDMYLERILHVESFGVPVTLAIAEQRGLDGWAVIEGWLVASEVAIRLACGCNVESLNSLGFHKTAIFGTLGAAAAAARMLGLDADRTASAMSLAVSFAGGTTEGWGRGSGRNKPIQPGWAAMSGVMAALLTETGYSCAHTTIDGPSGLYASHAWKHGWSPEPALDGLGHEWKCLDIAFKMYPAAGLCQAVIDCTKELVYEHDIRPEEVESVEVTVPSQYSSRFLHGRYEETFRPSSGYTMYGSWPCNVARMILNREIGLQHLTLAAVHEPTMLALADKVSCHPGADTQYPPDERPTAVAIRTARGVFERTRRKTLGHPDEVKAEEIISKFRRNAALVFPPDRVERLEAELVRLEDVPDIRKITGLLAA